MKSAFQIGLGIVVLMGAVAGVAYITQYTAPTKKPIEDKPEPPGPPRAAEPITFPGGMIAIWRKDLGEDFSEGADERRYAKQVEELTEYHYDFSFCNQHSQPASLKLQRRSCSVCSRVECAVVGEKDWADWQRQEAAAAALHALSGGPPLWEALATARLHADLTWQKLVEESPTDPDVGADVPAAIGGIGHPGFVRVYLKPTGMPLDGKPASVTVTLATQAGEMVAHPQLVLNYRTVPPMGSFPPVLEYTELGNGQKRTLELMIWSTTREQLQPIIELDSPNPTDRQHPCFELGKPAPLGPSVLRDLPKLLGKGEMKIDALCAYRVPLTVHESRNGRQLDLGPFSRRLVVAADAAAKPFFVPLVGIVRGEVRVLNGDAQERIPLGDFKVDRGASREVTLATGRTELDFDPAVTTTDAFLTATLLPPMTTDGQKQWKLLVEMKPDGPTRDLAPNTAVVLQMKIKGQETRKLRIPVTGNAHR